MSTFSLLASGGFEFNVHGFYIIDFLVLVGILWYFGKGPMQKFLASRRDKVKSEMDGAAEQRAEAQARFDRYNQLLEELPEEKARLLAEFARDGERERQRIKGEAEADAAKVARDATRAIAQEAAKLREHLEAEVAERALTLAEEKIRQRLNPMVHRQLVDQYITDLEKLDQLGDFSAA